MKRLLSVTDMAERYQVSKKTAQRYMRKMPHMEKPLRVTEQAVESWELGRMVDPDGTKINRTWNVRSQEGIIYIERRRKAT